MEKTCKSCLGSGYIRQQEEICNTCKGRKCIYCKSTGYSKELYTTCYYCDGSGIIGKVIKSEKI